MRGIQVTIRTLRLKQRILIELLGLQPPETPVDTPVDTKESHVIPE